MHTGCATLAQHKTLYNQALNVLNLQFTVIQLIKCHIFKRKHAN